MKIKIFFGMAMVSLPLLAYPTSPQDAFCSWKLAADSKYYEVLAENLSTLQNSVSKFQNLGPVDPQQPQIYVEHVAEIASEIQSTLASMTLLQGRWHSEETAKLQELLYPTPPTHKQEPSQAAPSFWDKLKSLFIKK